VLTLTLRHASNRRSEVKASQIDPAATSILGGTTLGGLLLKQKLLTEPQLAAAIARSQSLGNRLSDVLIELGLVAPESLLKVLGDHLGVETVRVNAYTINTDLVRLLPEKVARQHTAFPIQQVANTLIVALARPKDLGAITDLRFASGCEIETVLALESEIEAALNCYYSEQWLPRDLGDSEAAVVIDSPSARALGRDEANERSAVAVVERLVARAAAEGASDIHLEPRRDDFRVRFRVDGAFRDIAALDRAIAPAVIARVKVLSGMDIAEHRLPQDGRFSAALGAQRLDMRSSTYPTVHGEKAVLRLLDSARVRRHLDQVGMSGSVLERMRELIRHPEGLILITGPTGSGKTTTLYAALGELADTGRNIMTIENPVEVALPGVNQGQTNDRAGFTFAKGLRSILRQDPDVIMVGEIRDVETLETAVEASLTGHLVLSTIHTNSAVATIPRLLEMGLEPYLAAAGLLAVIGQRLVRRICATCREEIPTPPPLRVLFREGEFERTFRGLGCPDCRGTGYRGRLGIFDLVRMTDEMRSLVLGRAQERDMVDESRRDGTSTLREECLELVRRGETTAEEVLRVTSARK
jgi:type IV pilus assembly protein PilB